MRIQRDAEKSVRALAERYPVVVITGPRQAGKTTLAQMVFEGKPYVSLEDPDMRYLADSDPRSFLEQRREGAVLDEIQRCPELLSYLQGMVDRDPVPGRFVLTGSEQLGLMSKVSQSLAGRAAIQHLLPFSLAELTAMGRMPGEPNALLFSGFFPPIHDKNFPVSTWLSNYVQTYVERDVRQMVNVRDLSTFHRFLRLCAGRVGQLLNLAQMASDCGISHTTARAWISVLEASYIVFQLTPHHENFNKRLIKSPKLYFHDSGLAAWLLMIQSPEQLDIHPMRGALFENMVVAEAFKSCSNRNDANNLFFWRDQGGHEVDLLVDQGILLLPVEVKSGKTLNSDYFTGLKRWHTIAAKRSTPPVLIYGGSQSLQHDGVQVFAWNDPAWPRLF